MKRLIYILPIAILITLFLLLPTRVHSIHNPLELESEDVNYGKFLATAYTPSAGGINTDGQPDVTSTMMPAEEGVIAVNPDVIPYDSEMLIIYEDKVIRGVAGDTGGFAEYNPWQIDILMECEQEAMEWGKRLVHVIWWQE